MFIIWSSNNDLTLVAGNYYKLDGKVAVGIDMGSDGTKSDGAVYINN